MAPEDLHSPDHERFQAAVLDLYRRHPNTTGHVRRADRNLVDELFRQRVHLHDIDAALLLVAARCAHRPQVTIRSFHYFLPAILEVLDQPLESGYLRFLELRRQRTSADDHQPA